MIVLEHLSGRFNSQVGQQVQNIFCFSFAFGEAAELFLLSLSFEERRGGIIILSLHAKSFD